MNSQNNDYKASMIQAKLIAKGIFRQFLWRGEIMPAFWTITGTISLVVNLILVVVLIALGQQLFTIKQLISEQLITGLHSNFELMDAASIEQTIVVDDTIPVQFDVPVSANTWVTLTEPTHIDGVRVTISTSVLNINALADIILPQGTRLPITLDINVPIDQTVPVHLNVPVSIPLNETELHQPFVGLQAVVEPYDNLLMGLDNSWDETPICQGAFRFICRWFLIQE
ncbi:MAG: hypothetical protein U9Q82_05610 [Chloroflexota bacterium]|nr:hypothetical protein [Chloroflexota bacterium]